MGKILRFKLNSHDYIHYYSYTEPGVEYLVDSTYWFPATGDQALVLLTPKPNRAGHFKNLFPDLDIPESFILDLPEGFYREKAYTCGLFQPATEKSNSVAMQMVGEKELLISFLEPIREKNFNKVTELIKGIDVSKIKKSTFITEKTNVSGRIKEELGVLVHKNGDFNVRIQAWLGINASEIFWSFLGSYKSIKTPGITDTSASFLHSTIPGKEKYFLEYTENLVHLLERISDSVYATRVRDILD
jgi:hypothetical protein